MTSTNPFHLDGLDGSNPLAFLAALGTIRTLERAFGEGKARMGWSWRQNAWRPRVAISEALTPDAFVALLHDHLRDRETKPQFDLGSGENNLGVDPGVFRAFVLAATHGAKRDNRDAVDFAAALACEVVADRRSSVTRVRDTALRTMSGAGHQHFLGTMRNLITQTEARHIHKALFLEWQYDDPLRGLSLRWEPTEDRRHAYQWSDPTDATERRSGSMQGANRLAIEALPFFPTVPVNRLDGSTELETIGFRRSRRGSVEWTWPIWEPMLSGPVITTLLCLAELQTDSPRNSELRERGIAAAFRSTRISVDYYRNFTPAVAV